MRYTFLNTIQRFSATSESNFKMPIIGSDELYALIPASDEVTLLEGRQEGYDSITYFYEEVCTYLGFNPFKIKTFYINNRGLETMEKDVIDEFMGEYEVRNTNSADFYPDSSTNNNFIGYIYFADGYSNAQASIGHTPYGSGSKFDVIAYNIMERQTFFTTNDGVKYEFEIWPAEVIKTGYINTRHFARDNENNIKNGHVIINIWYNATTEKYNFNIKLAVGYYSTTRTNYIDNTLDGAKTDHVYNPGNPLDNKPGMGDDGGNGDYDDTDEPVDVPPLPSIDITSLGGLHLWKCLPADMAALFNYLSSHEPGESILKWFANPIQGITACYMLPYPVHATGSGEITVLGITTGVAAYKADQWTEYDLGSVYVPTRFGDCFLDYSPQTRIGLYLPFCGVKQVTADDIIGHNVGITYQFDNISGACTAFVTSDTKVRYTYSGSCAIGIPISQSNWGQCYIAAATAAAGALSGGIGAAAGAIAEGGSLASIGLQTIGGAVQGAGGLSAFNSKPSITRSGSFTGAGSALGVPHPFLIIERPDKANIGDPTNVIGITSGRVIALGSLSGFNAIENCHLHGIAATAEELDEIERLLYQGAIF